MCCGEMGGSFICFLVFGLRFFFFSILHIPLQPDDDEWGVCVFVSEASLNIGDEAERTEGIGDGACMSIYEIITLNMMI